MKRVILALVVLSAAPGAFGQQVFTRSDLNALLTSSTFEDFETYVVDYGAAYSIGTPYLDYTTVANGQGPGLVKPGAAYIDPSGAQIQWNGDNWVGLDTKTILSNGSTGDIRIDYTGFVQAMGLDAKAFLGYPYGGVMDVYSGAALLDSIRFDLVSGGTETVFLGYYNAAGITSVVVRSSAFFWSPVIDNHTFGVVPEPLALVTMGLGLTALARRRRR